MWYIKFQRKILASSLLVEQLLQPHRPMHNPNVYGIIWSMIQDVGLDPSYGWSLIRFCCSSYSGTSASSSTSSSPTSSGSFTLDSTKCLINLGTVLVLMPSPTTSSPYTSPNMTTSTFLSSNNFCSKRLIVRVTFTLHLIKHFIWLKGTYTFTLRFRWQCCFSWQLFMPSASIFWLSPLPASLFS